MFYDTRHDLTRESVHVYYVGSKDGGSNWTEARVSTETTSETGPGAHEYAYGDYNGLAARNGVAHLVWTDRRSGVPGEKEQIFTAKVVVR